MEFPDTEPNRYRTTQRKYLAAMAALCVLSAICAARSLDSRAHLETTVRPTALGDPRVAAGGIAALDATRADIPLATFGGRALYPDGRGPARDYPRERMARAGESDDSRCSVYSLLEAKAGKGPMPSATGPLHLLAGADPANPERAWFRAVAPRDQKSR